ncbi:MAG: SRPBCC family protein [Ilumatobacteraceae bacterium]
MRRAWVSRTVAAPAGVVWALLVDVDRWQEWGPSIRSAAVSGGSDFGLGTRGTVTTVVGVRLPFEVTGFEPGRAWSWRVAGVPATDHEVESVDAQHCRVRFGAPWIAAAYLVVCELALRRIDHLATAP